MSQPPYKVDALQIEPGSGQVLRIERHAATGSLLFKDHVVADGLLLSQMAGIGTVTGVLVVGRAGTGAAYTSIQEALDAVPASASASNPYVVLVFPGIYLENLTLEKAGVAVVALGRVVVSPVGATAPLTVQAGVSATPTSGSWEGVTFRQGNAGIACVLVTGGASSTVAADGLVFDRCVFEATGVGSYTVYGDTAGKIHLRECSAAGSVATAALRVRQCVELLVVGGDAPLVQADYDTALSRPSVLTSAYELRGCRTVGNVLSTLTSAGSLKIAACGDVGSVTVNGNRAVYLSDLTCGSVTLNGTTAGTARSIARGSVAGAGTWAERHTSGSVEFVATATEDVTFDVARPSASYSVSFDAGVDSFPWVTNKTAAGFRVNFAAPQTTTVLWEVFG